MLKGVSRQWAASGAMALTGDANGDVFLPPDTVIDRIVRLGDRVGVDGLAILGERAAATGATRHGSTSCSRSARLVGAADGWLAVNLPRPDDVDLVPAWLGIRGPIDPALGDPWAVVTTTIAARPTADVVAWGRTLGIPVSRQGEAADGTDPVLAERLGSAVPIGNDALVVDLSSLWAGPLCTQLLGASGATVVKVESTARPDGARSGPTAFFDLLHGGQHSVAVDFRTPSGIAALRALIRAADVVVEGSRPRALEQLGIFAAEEVREGPQVWLAITGHGRGALGRDGVAFGDDAAAAGGLLAWGEDEQPRFVADAIADPLAGMIAAAAVHEALARGGRWLLDVSLARAASFVAGPLHREPWSVGRPADAAPPRMRRPTAAAPTLGLDTEAILDEVTLPGR